MTSPVRVAHFQVFADYHQFYLWDAKLRVEAPTEWSDEDIANRVKVGPGIVVVCPIRNMHVPVTLEVYAAAAPMWKDAEWDHVAEASLSVASGALEVHESTGGPVAHADVAKGSLRVRVLMAGLGTLSADGLEGEDRYVLQVWPAAPDGLRVLKRFVEG